MISIYLEKIKENATFYLTAKEFSPTLVLSSRQVRPDSGRLGILLRRLSPIGGQAARYDFQPDKEKWKGRAAVWLCARDVYAIMQAHLEKYRRHVDGFDLDEAQKEELIHTVWKIMEGFVDRAFATDTAQPCRSNGHNGNSIRAQERVASKPSDLRDQFDQADGSAGRRKDTDHEGE